LQGLAGTYADESSWDKASTLIAEAVKQLDSLPDRDTREMVIVRRQLRVDEAWIYCCNNRNTAAVRIIDQVLGDIRQNSNLSSELARTLMVLGRVLWVTGKSHESEKQFSEASEPMQPLSMSSYLQPCDVRRWGSLSKCQESGARTQPFASTISPTPKCSSEN